MACLTTAYAHERVITVESHAGYSVLADYGFGFGFYGSDEGRPFQVAFSHLLWAVITVITKTTNIQYSS